MHGPLLNASEAPHRPGFRISFLSLFLIWGRGWATHADLRGGLENFPASNL